MIEIPEAYTLANQLNNTIKGKTIKTIMMNQSPHKFAWYNGDPRNYEPLLLEKRIDEVVSYNGLVEIKLDHERLLFGDGVNIRYYQFNEEYNDKNQLFIEFDDSTKLIGTVQMYGGIWAFTEGKFSNPYYLVHKQKPSIISKNFNYPYFKSLFTDETKTLSAKAFLATEQRIPGLGNGILQDILYHAKIHPKKKMNTLNEEEIENLFNSIKSVVHEMINLGGRDTERNLFGNYGGYKTKLSKNTVNTKCCHCNSVIQKAAYLGGSIYYCEGCQKL